MSRGLAIAQAMANQIDTVLSPLIEDIQVVGGLMWNPTPPAVDIFPDDPYEELLDFRGGKALRMVVRARVDTPDREGSQELLWSMMDSDEPTSIEEAILSDTTLGGVCAQVTIEEGPSDFGAFIDPGGTALLGVTWTVQILPKETP